MSDENRTVKSVSVLHQALRRQWRRLGGTSWTGMRSWTCIRSWYGKVSGRQQGDTHLLLLRGGGGMLAQVSYIDRGYVICCSIYWHVFLDMCFSLIVKKCFPFFQCYSLDCLGYYQRHASIIIILIMQAPNDFVNIFQDTELKLYVVNWLKYLYQMKVASLIHSD